MKFREAVEESGKGSLNGNQFCKVVGAVAGEWRSLDEKERDRFARKAAVAQSRRSRGLPPWSALSAEDICKRAERDEMQAAIVAATAMESKSVVSAGLFGA